jgi:hypothetical protein
MDNFHIDITSEGRSALATAMSLAFGKYHSAVAYAIREAVAGEKHKFEDDALQEKYGWMLGPKTQGKPKRLIFFWSDSETVSDRIALPFKLDATGAADFAIRWLGELDYGRQPDHDGDNEKGWRLYCEGWGHVDGHWGAFVAIAPAWAMYGK